MVYYGDEVGMWGANDPDDRKPMIWPDIAYEDEASLPNGTRRAPDKVAVNTDLQRFYRAVIGIRNTHPALQLGGFRTLLADDSRRLFGYEREYQGQRVRVVLNPGDVPQYVVLQDNTDSLWQDLLKRKIYTLRHGKHTLRVPARSGVVLAEHGSNP
jgi:cyclomaltodextrinase